MANKDYYSILGVSKDASDEDIKKAFRVKAKQYHPDLHSSKSEAEKKANEERFKEINHAYEVLTDKQKRANYDRFGDENGPMGSAQGFGGGGGGFWGGGFEDIISNIFDSFGGGARRSSSSVRKQGSDIGVELTIDFVEAAFGCTKEITVTRNEQCNSCGGTGAKDSSSYKTCGKCGGSGKVTYTQSTIFGTVSNTTVCDQCKGMGRIITSQCKSCGGKGYNRVSHVHKVVIPAGISHGQRMTYHGEGNAGTQGGSPGNLIIVISVRPHKYFKRKDFDLYLDLPVSFVTAAIGGEIDVPTLQGTTKYKIPEGTETGTLFRIKGKGIKYLRKEMYGDLYFTVNIETPKNLTSSQKDLLKTFNSTLSKTQHPKQKKFYD
ncbi:MAG: molecular chaperone DnaJ [Christensenellales bacterium]|jgi:molecular chaperone DnaJ